MTRFGFIDAGEARSQGELGARDRLEVRLAGCPGELHRAIEAVVVGERQGGIADLLRAQDQLLGV